MTGRDEAVSLEKTQTESAAGEIVPRPFFFGGMFRLQEVKVL